MVGTSDLVLEDQLGVLESAAELIKEGKKVFPEIMVPVVGMVSEL